MPAFTPRQVHVLFERAFNSGNVEELDTRAVIESGEGLAVLYGAWSLGPPSATQGLSTEVVRRQPDGSWMFVIDNPHTPL